MSTAPSPNSVASSQHDDYPNEMTDDERYLFDLNGYLIVRNVLTSAQVATAQAAIDARQKFMVPRGDAALRNAVPGTPLYGTGPGRQDLGRVLEWGGDATVFQSILAHPRLVPIFHGILGPGYRMDHLPLVIAQEQGAEGFQLHGGTIDCASGEYNPHLAYTCQHGTIRSSLLGCNVMLTDHNPGDGGFCIVPGSHKSNFVRSFCVGRIHPHPPRFVETTVVLHCMYACVYACVSHQKLPSRYPSGLILVAAENASGYGGWPSVRGIHSTTRHEGW